MKKSILLSTIALLGSIAVASAQKNEAVVIDDYNLVKVGQSVQATMLLQNPTKGKNSYKIIATPILVNNDRGMELPEVVFRSRKGRILDFRHRVEYPETTILANRGDGVEYTYTFPYKAWMDGSQLVMGVEYDGCCREFVPPLFVVADALNLPPEPVYVVKPSMAYIPTSQLSVTHRDSATIHFALASAKISDRIADNSASLARINQSMRDVAAMPERKTITAIDLFGVSSPEGSLAFNTKLSQNRAHAVRELLAKHDPNIKSQIRITSVAENWSGLVAALQNNPATWAQEVVKIASSNASDQEKDRAIATLNHGTTYRQLLKGIYPKLRLVNYTLHYTTTDRDLINLNAATAELEKGNTERAGQYLSSVESRSADYYNTLGVLQMLKGDYQQAATNLTKSAKMGLPEAKNNLKQLARKLRNIEIIKNEE